VRLIAVARVLPLLAVAVLFARAVFSQEPPESWGIGQPAGEAQITAWDIDVRPDGLGLPPGRGDARTGAEIYRQKCQHCHGAEGVAGPYGSLVGRLADDTFPFGENPALEKTVGNYWPYATTLYDYLRRAMPLDAPGSLSVNEIYSLVAYILAENRIIPEELELDQSNLAAVEMPARGRFVADDRRGGNEVR
jgi:cytochrome c